MRILLIEDDQNLCNGINFHLRTAGYTIDCSYDGEEGLYLILQQAYDLVILDRMLPSLDGITLLKQIRGKNIHTPVIMLTALNGIGDRVTGLDAGADDYLTKPFAPEELLARIRALSRRPTQLESIQYLSFEDVTLDITGQSLTGPTHSCSLSKRENSLAEVFLKNPNTTIPRNVILSRVWGPTTSVEDGNLDNYIHLLRRRLHTIGSSLQIKTVRFIGYRLEATNC